MFSVLKGYNRHIFRYYGISVCAFMYITVISVVLYLLFYQRTIEIEIETTLKWVPRNQRSCHIMSSLNDTLPLLQDNISMPLKSIFFHQTSCMGDLSARQACVVESAARAHPNHQINVLFTSPITNFTLENSVVMTLTENYKNVKLFRVHILNYAKGTPLLETIKKLDYDYLDSYMPELIKYLTVYKYSGYYLGLDVMVGQNFNTLGSNWVAKQTLTTISADVFSLSSNHAGRKIAKLAIGFLHIDLLNGKKPDLWSYSSTNILTRALQKWCTTQMVDSMSLSTCNDIFIYDPKLFYPISFYDRQVYFERIDLNHVIPKGYTYHIWERFTKYHFVAKSSLYNKIATAHCPKINDLHSNSFRLTYD